MAKGDEILVTHGSDNVFADLGVAEPEEELAKAQLATVIRATIRQRKMTQSRAAAIMGLDQPKVSALMNGQLSGFSSDRLLRCLMALGRNIDIVVTGPVEGDGRGRIRVVDEAA